MAPIDDLDGSPVRSGSAAYVVTCYNAGFEIKHQIRTYIREWNTVADFVAYKGSGGVTYAPDTLGVEGTDCEYSSVFGGACHDKIDFGDILSNAGGTYNTTPGAGAASTRASYFPNVKY